MTITTDLVLYVTTRGRATVEQQLTLLSLPDEWRARTVVVCPKNEAKFFNEHFHNLLSVQTPKLANLAEKRAWVFKNSISTKIMMLDDDAEFVLRRANDKRFKGYHPTDPYDWSVAKLHNPDLSRLYKPKITDKRLNEPFKAIERMLSKYAHGGISRRFMNHSNGSEFLLNRKSNMANAYHVPTVMKYCKLNRIVIASEYDYTLQLLEAGYESAIYQWAATQEPNGSNAPGGCSIYRTYRNNNLCKIQLSELHPETVSVKGYSLDQLDTPHIPFRISWSKAIKMGVEKYGKRKLVEGIV